MRKFLIALAALLVCTPLLAQAGSGPKYGKNGGVGSSTSIYSAGEPTGGTYAINGTTGDIVVNQSTAGSKTNWLNTAYLAKQIGGDDTIYAPPVTCLSNPTSPWASTATPFICGLFAVQSKDSIAGATPRAVDVFSINNSTVSTAIPIWTIYGECHNVTSVTSNTYCFEFDGRNIRGPPASKWNPFQTPGGGVTVGELACGAGLPSGTGGWPTMYNCSSALYIYNNNKPFDSGLSFLPGSVEAIAGISPAIQFPNDYALEWWSSSSTRAAYIAADSAGAILLAPSTNVNLPDGRGLSWGSTSAQASISGSTASDLITFMVNGNEVARMLDGVLDVGTTAGSSGYVLNVGGPVNGASYYAGGTAGVSCTAGTVNILTMVVTNGIVTHC